MSVPNGYIIGFAADLNQTMNFYWNGTVQVAIDSTTNPHEAAFYSAKNTARTAAAILQQKFPAQEVAVVPVYRSIELLIAPEPEILAPTPAGTPTGTPVGSPA